LRKGISRESGSECFGQNQFDKLQSLMQPLYGYLRKRHSVSKLVVILGFDLALFE